MSKVAFLFPGQGAQYIGMGRQLRETVPAAAKLFDDAEKILGYNLGEVCANGPAEQLNSTALSQPAIYVTSLAALESLRTTDPDAVEQSSAAAGLSLGEYSALAFAGAMSFEDGLRVVRRRGEAMQEAADATPGGMVSVLGLEQSKIEELCTLARSHGILEVANLLCPGNIAVSGTKAACDAMSALVAEAGGKSVRLAVAGAFHTTLMRPADRKLEEALAHVKILSPRIPVWSNVDAQPHTSPDAIRRLLVEQVLRPVLWEDTLRALLAAGYEKFYEIGPGRVLAGLLKRVQRKIDCRNVGG